MAKLSILKFMGAAALSLAISLGSVSCKKYEDGPGLTFRSAEKRATGTWNITEIEDGGDATGYYTFNEDGTMAGVGTAYILGTPITFGISGNWELTSDDDILLLTSDDGDELEYTIRRLTNKDFWIIDPRSDKMTKMEKK